MFRYSGFLPQSKDMQTGMLGSKLSMEHFVSAMRWADDLSRVFQGSRPISAVIGSSSPSDLKECSGLLLLFQVLSIADSKLPVKVNCSLLCRTGHSSRILFMQHCQYPALMRHNSALPLHLGGLYLCSCQLLCQMCMVEKQKSFPERDKLASAANREEHDQSRAGSTYNTSVIQQIPYH
ncbi:unnamed protein product [Pleuronectes platessa]|uniref:Uncharacterized protein n=1 Tax=Pleuronectes platessa TaxID=8262 RepID=A0A9N7VSF3_PLEPL|nr:unnamed protein product [Pleuronectes platessa]